ncbi:MAG: RDD family protein [Candidatus Acidiferrum sp.]
MESWDKLTIDTPEQTSLEYPIAGLGSRFLAILADTAIQIVLGFIVLIVGMIIGAGVAAFGGLGPQWVIAIVVVLIFLLNSGYFALFEIFWNGQTPGKRYAQIRVIKDDGRPIGAYEAIVRNALRLVDMLPAMYGIGLLSIFVSRQSKRLGDFVAGTVVVHEKTLEGVRPYVESNIDETLPPIDASNVTLDEVRLIETFLNRRDSLEPTVRTNMALQISNRLADKMEITISGWPRTERFLEAVIEQCRQSDRFRN